MDARTPKGMRLHIGIFGRMNVGKSSFLNLVAGQEVSITSDVPGTTTDVVEKTMELLPIGPVVFLDTAGLDDGSSLGAKRTEKTRKALDRTDVAVLVTEPNAWTDFEASIIELAKERRLPLLVVVNKVDLAQPHPGEAARSANPKVRFMTACSLDAAGRELTVSRFKNEILQLCPEDFLTPAAIVGDLVPAGGKAALIVPIDLEAPKGRLILPQVQVIRDLLDHDACVLVVKEREFRALLDDLRTPPDLVVCDSQVVQKMVADTPAGIRCTTFSILFSRFKGDLNEMVRGVRAVDLLKNGDRVLIAEACTHHAAEDDIGRVKIPRWLKQYTGLDLDIRTFSGCDFPEDLVDYKLVIHCGSCMLNRRSMLSRIEKAKAAGVAMTNYGVVISYLQGVLGRVLSPFPSALNIYENEIKIRFATKETT